jgi:hypothetical protein
MHCSNFMPYASQCCINCTSQTAVIDSHIPVDNSMPSVWLLSAHNTIKIITIPLFFNRSSPSDNYHHRKGIRGEAGLLYYILRRCPSFRQSLAWRALTQNRAAPTLGLQPIAKVLPHWPLLQGQVRRGVLWTQTHQSWSTARKCARTSLVPHIHKRYPSTRGNYSSDFCW